MQQIIRQSASAAGLVGVLICLIAGLGRVAGYYYLLGFATMTLFNVGVGLMVLACLLRLQEIAPGDR